MTHQKADLSSLELGARTGKTRTFATGATQQHIYSKRSMRFRIQMLSVDELVE